MSNINSVFFFPQINNWSVVGWWVVGSWVGRWSVVGGRLVGGFKETHANVRYCKNQVF